MLGHFSVESADDKQMMFEKGDVLFFQLQFGTYHPTFRTPRMVVASS